MIEKDDGDESVQADELVEGADEFDPMLSVASDKSIGNVVADIMDHCKRWTDEHGYTIVIAVGAYDVLDQDSNMAAAYFGNHFMALGMVHELPGQLRFMNQSEEE